MKKFHPALALLIAALAIIAHRAHAAHTAAGTDSEPDTPRKTLLMHTMPWYTSPEVRGKWGGHWAGWHNQHNPSKTNKQGLPDIWSHYHPLIGPYDSTDPHAVECHLLQMKLAGVDGVIVDWYGITDAADYPENHAGAEAIWRGAGRLGMAFAVCYEDRTVDTIIQRNMLEQDLIPQHLARTFEWLEDNWFTDPRYVKLDGRPLLLNFGPIYVKDPVVWASAFSVLGQPPAFCALHHLWRDVDADGGFTWVHPDVWKGHPTEAEIKQRLHKVIENTSRDPTQVIPSALPGFHDIYQGEGYPYVAHRGGATLRETLDVAMQSESPIVQLVTWNDYGEGTVIEPTHEFGYLFLEIIQDARRAEMGSFPHDHDDLRLPARLFRLRKAGEAPAQSLDNIAELLSSGDTDQARAIIERLTTSGD